MKTKTVDIRYIETRKVQFLDGTEHYPEFYIRVKFTDMVYLQNGKCCRLEVVGSADDTYNTDFEASIHFGGKAYDLKSDKHVDILAKRLGCRSFSIYSLRAFIEEELIEMCSERDMFIVTMTMKLMHSPSQWIRNQHSVKTGLNLSMLIP